MTRGLRTAGLQAASLAAWKVLSISATTGGRGGGATAGPWPRAARSSARALVERFDIEPYSDFSTK